MKKIVWANKSNKQLCITIPKNSGIKEGDIVNIEKQKIKTIVYTTLTGDLFHYGHLKVLEAANEKGDFHICGVLTNDAIADYKNSPVADLKERMAIISSLRCVDMVLPQKNLDPTENIKQLTKQFKDVKFVLVFGSNWNQVPGCDYIKKINGEIFQPPFYEKLSQERILEKLSKYEEKA